jgi:hypothetical protein
MIKPPHPLPSSASSSPETFLPPSTLLPAEKSPQYVAILEDALDQLGVLMDIESDYNKTDARPVSYTIFLTIKLGEEITRILKDQRALESRYKELVADQNTLKSHAVITLNFNQSRTKLALKRDVRRSPTYPMNSQLQHRLLQRD